MKISIPTILVFLSITTIYGQGLELQFNPIPSNFNVYSPNPIYALDINYDNIDINKQAFHIFLPDTSGNYPLVIFIHGGGFTGGSRDDILTDQARLADIKYYLEHGVAYASIGYRLIETIQADTVGVIKCLMDCKRALQFIRFHAPSLYIQPHAIALMGSSAGAGTSLWLATMSDMANSTDSDIIFRESTRVCAAAVLNSQSTYDLYKWETLVYQNFDGQGANYTVDSMVNLLGFRRYSNFYGGIDSNYHILYDPQLIQYRENVDMLYHMTSDDPPLFIYGSSTATHPSQDLFHHPFQSREINTAALNSSIAEVKAIIPALGINSAQGENVNSFILRHLLACSTDTTSVLFNAHSFQSEISVYPNPFNSTLTFSWYSPQSEKATLILFDLFGRKIKTLIDDFIPQGEYAISFESDCLMQGIYFYQLKTENYIATGKLMKVN